MKRILSGSSRRALPRARLILLALLGAISVSATMASSASAFSWWIGSQSNPEMLTEGSKIALGSGSDVHSPFTLKWLKGYEVKCGAVKYDELYIEGPVFLGAHSISFEQCTSKKPKGATVAGGTIETGRLVGEIKPAGSKVEFDLKPVSGAFASFTLERTISPKVKHKHGRKPVRSRQCRIEVTVSGAASGLLGDATKISTEKTFEFDSKTLDISQVKRCHKVPPGSPPAHEFSLRKSSDARPALTQQEEEEEQEATELKEQEEEEARELEEEAEEAAAVEAEELEETALEEAKEKTLAEAAECRENEGAAKECKQLEKEAKEIEEIETERAAEKAKEVEEIKKEEEGRAEEEATKPIEGNKGKTGYNGGVGWGV